MTMAISPPFMRWLIMTHSQRWHAFHQRAESGHLYQVRFKSFPVESDDNFLTVCRHVERNDPAGQPGRASAGLETEQPLVASHRDATERPALTMWPIERPRDWTVRLSRPPGPKDDEAVQRSKKRGQSFGSEAWHSDVAERFGLESLFRPRFRPRKYPEKAPDPFCVPPTSKISGKGS